MEHGAGAEEAEHEEADDAQQGDDAGQADEDGGSPERRRDDAGEVRQTTGTCQRGLHLREEGRAGEEAGEDVRAAEEGLVGWWGGGGCLGADGQVHVRHG